MPENGLKTLEELNAEFLKKRREAAPKTEAPDKGQLPLQKSGDSAVGVETIHSEKPEKSIQGRFQEGIHSFLKKKAEPGEGVRGREEAASEGKPASARQTKIVKIATNLVFYLVLAAVLIGSAAFALSDSPGKSIFGYRFYNILTASMAPTYRPNDMIIVKMADPQEIAVDDVITFMPGNERKSYLTHRVIGVIPNYNGTGKPAFQTKGDANESADSFLVKPDQVIGKVAFGIPFLGGIVKFIGNNAVLVIIIIVLAILLCIFLRALFDVNRKEPQPEKDTAKAEAENHP